MLREEDWDGRVHARAFIRGDRERAAAPTDTYLVPGSGRRYLHPGDGMRAYLEVWKQDGRQLVPRSPARCQFLLP